MTRVFVLYRDHAPRRGALREPPGSVERYRLFGLDEMTAAGLDVRHNLERRAPQLLRRLTRPGNRMLARAGGYGGDFATVLANRRMLDRSDVVLSTVDTVGLPLVLTRHVRLVRSPLVYVSVGLPERLEQLRGTHLRAWYRRAFARVEAIIAYSEPEIAALRAWLDPGDERADRFHFVPFGVDTAGFAPDPAAAAEHDVVTVGADPHRDFSQVLRLAAERPALSVLIIASPEHARSFGSLPANVAVEVDVPLDVVRQRLLAARVVALPIDLNTYSSATTVLLQAMACARPVVLTRTPVATGYHLVDGVNCVLSPPGNGVALGAEVVALLADDDRARRLGAAARKTVVEHLGWARYTTRLRDIVVSVARVAKPGAAGGPAPTR